MKKGVSDGLSPLDGAAVVLAGITWLLFRTARRLGKPR